MRRGSPAALTVGVDRVLRGPRQRVVGDLLPPRRSGKCGRPGNDRNSVRVAAASYFAALWRLALGGNDVVLVEGDEEQRRAALVGEVDAERR